MNTIIRPCACIHEYQDKQYGKGMRVHNLRGPKHKDEAFCTVCGKMKIIK